MPTSKTRIVTIAVALAAIAALAAALSSVQRPSPIASDESVWFFPTAARLASNGDWELPIHAWVFELGGAADDSDSEEGDCAGDR